jgi:glycosyltransferase involved in cell wall biosynthesis
MIKIAIIYDSSFPDLNCKSANDRRVFNIRLSLLQEGIKSDILIPSWRSKIEYLSCVDNNIGIKIIGKKYKFSLLNRFFYYYLCYKEIKKHGYKSVLFYNSIWDSSLLIIALRILGIKVGLEICDKHSENLVTKNGLINRIKRLLVILPTEKILHKLTDFNIVINKSLYNIVFKKKPCLILPILVDNEYFKFDFIAASNFRNKYEINENEIILTFCGSYWYYEGSELLIEAVNKIIISTKIRNFKIFFVGNSTHKKYKPNLIDLTNKYNLNSIIYFTGRISEIELLAAYSATDIFILPQKKDGFTDFAFPTIIGEYASMGKPIIASKTGELDLIFSDNKDILFFDNMNIDDLAIKIKTLLLNEPLRIQLGDNAKILSEVKFGLSNNGFLLKSFLKNVLN